jgi:circadian clock protein KaiC
MDGLQRVASGNRNIDEVLGGGLPTNSIALLAGAPGSGKTMLAQQYAFSNGTIERPALIITTINEPLDKVIRFGQGLDFFDSSAVGSRVIYESLADVLTAEGLAGAMDRLVVLLTTLRPGLLVIDSFRAFGAFASELEHRRFVSELAQRLSATAVTSIWVGEYRTDVLDAPEAAVADMILWLRSEKVGQRTLRFLEVLKLRGSGFLAGEHSYRLGTSGVEVFTRLADPIDALAPDEEASRISLGSRELDTMLSGGVWPGTSTLVVGPAGVGKTMLGLEFLTHAAEQGQNGVFATLQESRSQMARMLWGDGRDTFEGRITFHHRSPVDIYIDEWVGELFENIAKRRARVVVIDSLSDLRLAARDDKRFEEFMYSLVQRLARYRITSLMTLESNPVLGFEQLPATPLASLVDNLILLGYQYEDGHVDRLIHVLKSRASDHDSAVRRMSITSSGLQVGDVLKV